MPSGLRASSLSIGDIFASPFLLNVPQYQRPYSWSKDEAGQLLDDILESAGIDSDSPPDSDYFLGAILLMEVRDLAGVKSAASLPHREFDIVDGQQRLITLMTLIAVLRDLEDDARGVIAKACASMVTAQLRSGFFRSKRVRLLIARSERKFFETYVLEAGATRLAPAETIEGPEAALLEVRNHFIAELTGRSADERVRLFEYVREHCEAVAIQSDDIDRAYRMFIVLNERGKKLQRNDILKADVISRLPSEEVAWAVSAWDKTARSLGDDFETFFSHLRTIYGHSRPQIVSAVRAVVREEGGAEPFLRKAFLPLAETFTIIRANPDGELTPRMRWYLHYLNRLPDGDWAPAAMLALKSWREETRAAETMLGEIDRLAHLLRLLCLGTGRRKKRFADVVDAMRGGEALNAQHKVFALSRDEVRNIAFHLKDMHKRSQKMCKLLLLRLNDEMAGAITHVEPESYTIEHVLPQRPPNASEWRRWYPSAEERARYTESLGNLVLITQSQNDKARNALFAEKKAIFGQGYVLPITRSVLQCDAWHKFEIDAREEHLLGIIRRIWRIDLPNSRPAATAEVADTQGASVE